MAWNPYSDYKNRGFNHILTTLFPEQTKTLPRILVWGLVFLIDLMIGAYFVHRYDLLGWCRDMNTMTLAAGAGVLVVLGVFWLQGVIWGFIARLVEQIMA